jgi:perosamine synthetase
MYSILLAKDFPLSRDEVMLSLRQQNIDSRPFFYPIHIQPPYQANISLPVAEDLSRRGVNLPSAVTLNEEDIHRIVQAIREMA